MSKQQKQLRRLASKPKDFTWSELVSLMEGLGFEIEAGPGSGRKFIHRQTAATLFIHEPHPTKVLKHYQVLDTIRILRSEGFLK